jgi:hypothetical protein
MRSLPHSRPSLKQQKRLRSHMTGSEVASVEVSANLLRIGRTSAYSPSSFQPSLASSVETRRNVTLFSALNADSSPTNAVPSLPPRATFEHNYSVPRSLSTLLRRSRRLLQLRLRSPSPIIFPVSPSHVDPNRDLLRQTRVSLPLRTQAKVRPRNGISSVRTSLAPPITLLRAPSLEPTAESSAATVHLPRSLLVETKTAAVLASFTSAPTISLHLPLPPQTTGDRSDVN